MIIAGGKIPGRRGLSYGSSYFGMAEDEPYFIRPKCSRITMTRKDDLDAIMAKLARDKAADVMIVGRPYLGRVTEWLRKQGITSSRVRTWFDDKEVQGADLCIVTAIDDWRRLKPYCTDRREFRDIEQWDKRPEQLVFILKNEFRTLRLVELDSLE